MKPSEQELSEFINALQLSIETKVINVKRRNDDIVIFFERPSDEDVNLYRFLQFFDSRWNDDRTEFVIYKNDKLNWPKLTLFLLLTRMNEENILKMVELDPSVLEIAEKIGVKLSDCSIESVAKASQILFKKMEEKGITIREIAEKTGLTQVTISNFKSGKDIKFSNLLNISRVLGMSVKIK
jgi:DNA-binding Xre family transcriptional regulator